MQTKSEVKANLHSILQHVKFVWLIHVGAVLQNRKQQFVAHWRLRP